MLSGYVNTAGMVNDPDSWGGPLGGVDLEAQAGLGDSMVGGVVSLDVWTFVIIVGALALLWFFGGVIFRRINIP